MQIFACVSLTYIIAEYPDDHIVPRSSSVVVKRVPLIRGARSRFGRYLAGGTLRQTPTAPLTQHNRAPAPAAIWARGTSAYSKRFDGKEEPKAVPVSVLPFSVLIIRYTLPANSAHA